MKNCSKLFSYRLFKQAQEKKVFVLRITMFSHLSAEPMGGPSFLLSYRSLKPRPDNAGFMEAGQDPQLSVPLQSVEGQPRIVKIRLYHLHKLPRQHILRTSLSARVLHERQKSELYRARSQKAEIKPTYNTTEVWKIRFKYFIYFKRLNRASFTVRKPAHLGLAVSRTDFYSLMVFFRIVSGNQQ